MTRAAMTKLPLDKLKELAKLSGIQFVDDDDDDDDNSETPSSSERRASAQEGCIRRIAVGRWDTPQGSCRSPPRSPPRSPRSPEPTKPIAHRQNTPDNSSGLPALFSEPMTLERCDSFDSDSPRNSPCASEALVAAACATVTTAGVRRGGSNHSVQAHSTGSTAASTVSVQDKGTKVLAQSRSSLSSASRHTRRTSTESSRASSQCSEQSSDEDVVSF